MWGLSSWVINLPSALSRVIAAWAGASAHPLAPGPCKQMAADEGQEDGNEQERQASPTLLPSSGHCRDGGGGAGSLEGWLPSRQGLSAPRSRDPHRHRQPLPVLAPAQAHRDALASLCGPSATFLLHHTASFMLRKPQRVRVVLSTQPSPAPSQGGRVFLHSGGFSKSPWPPGSDVQITLAVQRLREVK